MHQKTISLFALTAAACLATFSGVHADTLGIPFSIGQAKSTSSIDPNTFIVGHPASPTNRIVHANYDHPAVAMHRANQTIDANQFLVQPPTAVAWIAPSEAQGGNMLAMDLNELPPTAAGKPAR